MLSYFRDFYNCQCMRMVVIVNSKKILSQLVFSLSSWLGT